MVIKIRKIQTGDLEYIRQNPLEGAVKNYPDMCPPETSFAGLVDDKLVGVGGVVILWEGVAEGWIILSKDVLNYKLTAYRHVKGLTEMVIKHFNLRRLQVTVRTDYPKAIEMAEKLGFVREGKMIGYCPDGQDAWLYAKIFERKQ